MNILTFKEASVIINKFKEIEEKNLRGVIVSSNLVYTNNLDVGFGDCLLEIYDYNDGLYMRTLIDGIDVLEPLLIQVEDDGTIVDFILLDFVLRFKESLGLDRYFVLSTDYTFIMDRVR